MAILTARAARYAAAWISGRSLVVKDELVIDRDGTPVPATFVRPGHLERDLPAWVILHGITRTGRAHAQLVRFTEAMAAAGLASIVPEVPEWRALDLAPRLCTPTIGAAIRGLRDTGIVRDAPVGVLGFSFGAPHAIAASAHPTLRDQVGGACGFGGYCALEPTFRFMMTGRHTWAGMEHQVRPDPYGRWIVAANYLTALPEYAQAHDVAHALRALAHRVGDVGAPSWDPIYDPAIAAHREAIAEERRELFDRLAPSSHDAQLRDASVRDRRSDDRVGEPDAAEGLAEGFAAAARRHDPDIDPRDRLAEVEKPAHVLHGYRDTLIPFSESHRLAESLPARSTRLTVTRLFGHSAQDRVSMVKAVRELPRFARAMSGLLATV